MADKDILAEAKEAFQTCVDAESENRRDSLDDLEFVELNKHWPDKIAEKRRREDRPCLVIPKLPAFIRQVANDVRQNKPQIKVRPVDSGADVETADIYSGLIRNIEQVSSADIAYDTAAKLAISCGVGYIRVNVDYAHQATFDKELQIKRVANPFSVYGDPHSVEADGCDWNVAFVTELMSREQFQLKYKGAEEVNWDDEGYNKLDTDWVEGENIIVAEYWRRAEYDCPIVHLSNGMVVEAEAFEGNQELFALTGVTVIAERTTKRNKVTQRILTGAEVLSENSWAGQYIPVVPVYGEEVNIEGKRIWKSLIRDAKDAQRRYNYMRSAEAELVALQPKAPFIGPVNAFNTDAVRWATANTESHAYLEYDGNVAPQRQFFGGPPAAEITEALAASDDIKSILGMYDASLGQRSNETSGKAIMARQREGDISTFHFIDNLSRSIRQVGRILIDLIPLTYTGPRIVRVLGAEGDSSEAVIGGDDRARQEQLMQMVKAQRVYDLSAGKYDLVVEAGPSFTTRRAEAAEQMVELIRSFPDAAPVIGDILAKNLDWPGAEEIARRLKSMLPPQMQQQPDGNIPEELQGMIQGMQQQMQQMGQQLQMAQAEVEQNTAKANADFQAKKYAADKDAEIEREKIASAERIKVAEANAKAATERASIDAEDKRAGRDRAHELRMTRMSGQMTNGGQPVPADPFDDLAAAIKAQGEMNAASTQALMDAITQATRVIVAAVTAPKELTRDSAGRPSGVRIVTH